MEAGEKSINLNTIDMLRDKNNYPVVLDKNKLYISKNGRFTIVFDDDTYSTLDPSLYVKEKVVSKLLTPPKKFLKQKA